MKLSVSLSERDVALLDEFAARQGLSSRSAAVQAAIRALRHEALVQAYVEEFDEWEGTEDKALWDGVSAVGLDGDAAG